MNPSIISSILITLFGIFTGLSGSEWFWGAIILFPIFIGWKLELTTGVFFGYFMLLVILVMSEGAIAFGDIIVFVYILLLFLVIGRIIGVREGTADNISLYLIFSIVATIVGTIAISIMMP